MITLHLRRVHQIISWLGMSFKSSLQPCLCAMQVFPCRWTLSRESIPNWNHRYRTKNEMKFNLTAYIVTWNNGHHCWTLLTVTLLLLFFFSLVVVLTALKPPVWPSWPWNASENSDQTSHWFKALAHVKLLTSKTNRIKTVASATFLLPLWQFRLPIQTYSYYLFAAFLFGTWRKPRVKSDRCITES